MRFSFFSGLFLLLAFSCSAVLADDCSEVHLDQDGGSMAGVPVTDQSDLPICFAHSGSDLGNAYLRSHGDPDFLISPLHLAIEYEATDRAPGKAGDSNSFLSHGGQTGEALKFLKAHAACNAKALRSGLVQLRSKVESACRMKPKEGKESLECIVAEGSPVTHAVDCIQGTLNKAYNVEGPKECFKDSMMNLAGTCNVNNRKKVALPDPVYHPIKSSEGFDKVLSDQFDQRPEPKQPFTISVASDVLIRKPPYLGVKTEGGSDQRFYSGKDGHATTVIGRMRNPRTQECELQVKNSWGTSCAPYQEAGWRCEGGKVWVSKKDLSRNTVGVTRLSDTPPTTPRPEGSGNNSMKASGGQK